MKNKTFNTVGFNIIALYILLSFITLSFVLSIIFENQTELISKNMVLKSEKQISELTGALKKFSIEMKQGNLFKVKNDKEMISHLVNIIGVYYTDFLIVSDKNNVTYKSSDEINLPENYKEDILRSLTTRTFSGKDYYLRIDEKNRIINFYIPLDEIQSGNSILLVKNKIGALNDSLIGLYKQAVYIIIVICLFHLIFAASLYRHIINPMKIINDAAKKISEGDLTARITVPVKNRGLYTLIYTFNSMAESI